MKFIYILLFSLSIQFSFAQNDINRLVEKGITYHDAGNYEKAIETYQQALQLDPKSSLVNYEISLSYFHNKDYKKAIKHSDVVIDNDDKHVKAAYITKGSCLDNLGKTKESIKLFKKGIRKFENDGLIYYNLALNHYKLKDFDEAEKVITQGVGVQNNHASSHLLLAYLNYDKGRNVQTLLNLHYFLFLEPNSRRSPQAAGLIKEIMGANVSQDKDKPNTINISLSLPDDDDDFGAAEMMLSMLEASKKLEKNEGKSEDELFIANTDSFFTMMGELKKKKHKGIYWDIYVPFFDDLAKSEFMETYYYHVMQSVNENSTDWLNSHPQEVDALMLWLKSKA
nr:tetratricopeptide repeat protein [uncultured Psychroserpens sp.]